MRRFITALLLCAATASAAGAQRLRWSIIGDTAGAREGCSGREAVMAIDRWFDAFNDADSAGLVAEFARPFLFTTGTGWMQGNPSHRFGDNIGHVVAYARQRTRLYDERLALDSVRFLGWNGARLDFVPYVSRTATDLAGWAIPGIGKGEYWCRLGIKTLSLAPDVSRNVAVEAPTGRPTVKITNLANAGVMISAGADKVLVDALFRRYRSYAVPDEQTQVQVALAQPPYSAVDAILITHHHGDHFAPEPIASHLRFSPATMVMSSPQVIDSLRASMNLRNFNSARLIARRIEPGKSQYTVINGVTIYVYRVPHGGVEHRAVEHLAFIVQMAGLRVLHLGDAEISEQTIAPLGLHKAGIDVALVPYWALLSDESRRVIAQYIQPTRVIAIHVDAGLSAGRSIASKVAAAYPDATTFFRPDQSFSWSCFTECTPRP
ncbi:MAG TPA: MBL fold metallo-hydrolase [Gemmatimonadaceae bacterium]|nr:MBL fold metallo-hydrolase [Gemmatimonadaceae bacterium]